MKVVYIMTEPRQQQLGSLPLRSLGVIALSYKLGTKEDSAEVVSLEGRC